MYSDPKVFVLLLLLFALSLSKCEPLFERFVVVCLINLRCDSARLRVLFHRSFVVSMIDLHVELIPDSYPRINIFLDDMLYTLFSLSYLYHTGHQIDRQEYSKKKTNIRERHFHEIIVSDLVKKLFDEKHFDERMFDRKNTTKHHNY